MKKAYLVFHDGFTGAMEVWPESNLEIAEAKAKTLQEKMEQIGEEDFGCYRAYEKLPTDRCKIWKIHGYSHPVKVKR